MVKTTTYLATNTKNGKWYVGSTIRSFERRKKDHLHSKANDPFHCSLRKNKDSFVWEVLDVHIGTEINRDHEQFVLDGWFSSQYCYNLSSNASGMCPLIASKTGKKTIRQCIDHPNTKLAKQRDGKTKAVHLNSHPNTKEVRITNGKKNIEKMLAHPNTISNRSKLGKHMSNHPNSVACRKRLQKEQSRKIKVTHTLSGEELIFSSCNEAARVLGLGNGGNISAVARGTRKQTMGYTAEYI